ncbi:MAG: TonB-dependent receptor [SAR86 cluster bacterium SAR86B]|jgi:TonB-dependent receptor|uniref:TonB-dependent receptor n=1 Tax=SAR86 cluster bacterium SAR86B TaxID=1123867 RepID=J4WVC1_9GAMM|nr:MAG: TonB-dependent receptor [SAR86 cluster bacterium SAR86B]|tara:strand:- start:1510 stop:4434 length:2925 start_codon:yes stop_codon:yes gene_type:complete
MFNNNSLSRKELVLGSLAISAATLPVFAQDTSEEEIEEVVVLGSYSKSLVSALDRKRDADGVVDAITAEDIGKYPDTNLAESLARVSGVSIDRFNGEGSRVTVRGLGPEYNLVTLNGRSMPTVGGRSFDFADISPHGVAAVEVYKTGNAAIPTGGIGSTVNMVTTKPLDAPGFVAVLDGSLVDSFNVAGDDYTPQVMGIYSNTFADDTIGVSLSASVQERDNREEKARVNTWLPNFNTDGIDPAVWENNNQRADGTTWYPQDADYQWLDNQTERTNGQLTLQWQASEDVRATVDYTYSEREFFSDRRSIGIWFVGGGNVVNAVTNENGTFTTVTEAGGDYASNMSKGGFLNTNDSLGFNLEWDASDNLTVTFDAHDSTAEGKGAPDVGSDTFLITGNTCFGDTACIGEKTATYPSNGIHIFNFNVAGKDEFEASDIGTLFGASSDYYSENEMSQYQLSALWENSDSDSALQSIKFGYATAEQNWLNQNRYSGQLPAGWWLTSAEFAPDEMWVRQNVGSILGDAANSYYGPTYYFGTTWDQLIGFYQGFVDTGEWIDCCNVSSWGADYRNEDGTGNINPGPIDSDARVKEETSSFFVQFDFETEFNGMPVDIVTGLRYESTDVTSSGLETPVTNIAWVGGNEFSYVEGEKGFTEGTGSNKFFLPSFDSKIGISDNEVVRFSYSRSISRPGIGNLRSTTDFVGNPQVNQRNAVVGNPGLMPYVSDNLDLSYENYYAPGSYFAVGYWRKIVDNFLQTRITQESVNGIRDVYEGQAAEACRANGATSDLAVYNCLAGTDADGNQISGVDILPDGDDPLAVFNISRTVNEESGLLYGFEFAAQHLFGNGYGLTANYTTVNGDLEADRDATDVQFALTGMNDSANLSGFYETDKYSVRLSWNWRDEFLGGFDQHSSPVYTEEYEQWDLNATYSVNDNFELYAQGLNITGETIRTYIRYNEQLSSLGQYGTTYIIGGRYRF